MAEKLEAVKGNSEIIDLEYLVEFQEGLKTNLCIYGVDSQTGSVYGANVYIGLEIGTGFRPVERENKRVAAERWGSIGTPVVIHEFDAPKEEYEEIIKKECIANKVVIHKFDAPKEEYEELIKKECIANKTNLIKVKSREHVMPAICRHAYLYGEQFKSLGYELSYLFDVFLQEHTGYFSAVERAEGEQKETPEERQKL